jgi:hypothetical protein
MQLTISPFKGVDDVEFGMSPKEVRKRVGGKFRPFKRSVSAAVPCDYFEDLGVFFYYDYDRKLAAIEFAGPAQPTVAGLKLLELSFRDAYSALHDLDDQTKKESDGAIAFQLGVSIYAPLAKANPMAPVESLLAFRKGYYN